MELLHSLLPRLLSAVMSWIDATNLRNRVYLQQDRIDILVTALDDVHRMTSDPKIKALVRRALDR